MGVKPVDEIGITFRDKSKQMEQLKADVREIIRKKIRVAEITDPPYPDSTMRERLHNSMRYVLWEDYGRKAPAWKQVFKISYRKTEGKTHWYVLFDVEYWDSLMGNI